jgi:hypothetical protein
VLKISGLNNQTGFIGDQTHALTRYYSQRHKTGKYIVRLGNLINKNL